MKACTISGNQTVGGDGGTGAYVGDAEGGAINNYGDLTISGSSFDQNRSLGGSGGNSGPGLTESFDDYGFGGAIATTEASLSVTNSNFIGNSAVGGNNSIATATDIGGWGVRKGVLFILSLEARQCSRAAPSPSTRPRAAMATTAAGRWCWSARAWEGRSWRATAQMPLARIRSRSVTASSPRTVYRVVTTIAARPPCRALSAPGLAPASPTTRAVSANVSGSILVFGHAAGGNQNTAGGTGAVFAGFGAGGGIFNYLGNYNSPGYGLFSTSSVTVSDSVIGFNHAQGGGGGNGEGGGIAVAIGSIPDSPDSCSLSVSGSTVIGNTAQGGNGGSKADGGNGLGGGILVAAMGDATLTDTVITANAAVGDLAATVAATAKALAAASTSPRAARSPSRSRSSPATGRRPRATISTASSASTETLIQRIVDAGSLFLRSEPASRNLAIPMPCSRTERHPTQALQMTARRFVLNRKNSPKVT